MKILIIEDNEDKFKNVKAYLNKCGETDITWKKARNAGLIAIIEKAKTSSPYEMVITDNLLPLYEGDLNDIEPFAVDITNEIRRRYNDDIIVCICSSDEITEEHDANYTIKYDSSVELTPVFESMMTDAYAYKALCAN